eukprot:m.231746 g.231746  ORF g.231746 m.231746 type:complete len:298 (-) comp18465_c0_seq1:193-1086(-)
MAASPNTSFDKIHDATKHLLLQNHHHDGLKFAFTKMVTDALQVSHSLHVAPHNPTQRHPTPSTYTFSSAFLGPHRPAPGEFSPIVTALMDTEGNMQTSVSGDLTPALKGKVSAQASGPTDWQALQVELDYKGSDFVSSLKLVNINPLIGTGICCLNYLQRLTPRLSLGGEFTYQQGPIGINGVPVLGGKYETEKTATGVSLSLHGLLQITTMRAVSEKLALAADLDINLMQGRSVAAAGAVYRFKTSSVHAQINSDLVCGVMLERQLLGPNVTLTLCGSVDHSENKSAFGIGFNINM